MGHHEHIGAYGAHRSDRLSFEHETQDEIDARLVRTAKNLEAAARAAEAAQAAADDADEAAMAAAGNMRRPTPGATLAAHAAASWGVSETDATALLPASRWDDASALDVLRRLQSGEYVLAADGEIYGLDRRGDEAWRVMRLAQEGRWWSAEVWSDATFALHYTEDKGRSEAEAALRQIVRP